MFHFLRVHLSYSLNGKIQIFSRGSLKKVCKNTFWQTLKNIDLLFSIALCVCICFSVKMAKEVREILREGDVETLKRLHV